MYHSIERVVNCACAEISLILYIEDSNNEHDDSRALKDKGSMVYRIFNRLDEKIFIRGHNALEIKDLKQLLSTVPVIKAKRLQKESGYYFEPGVIDAISRYGIDILIQKGLEALPVEILSASRYGVWAYQFEGDPHGFWEAIKGQPETKEMLLLFNEDFRSGRIIYRSSSSTYPFSPARNRNRSLWKASSFLPRQIALLSYLGGNEFFSETESYQQEDGSHFNRASKMPPSNWLCLWLIVRLIFRNVHELFSRIFYQDAWFLLFSPVSFDSISFKDFKRIVPPKDRFWADPNIIRKDNRYFVFIEEFIFQEKKGQLSVFDLDRSGKYSLPVPILKKEYHLSYPNIFEWKGQYYMVPESADHGTIDLYECIDFPYKWAFKMHLMENVKAVDTTLLFQNNRWWLFTGISENEESFPEVELFLFYSDDPLTSSWKPHPRNPIVSDVKKARPAGQIFSRDGRLFRPSQDCSYTYGFGFDLNEILILSETEYREKSIISVKPDWDRKITATHTYGTDGQIQIIDAYTKRRKFL
jgi:hypothetical protein